MLWKTVQSLQERSLSEVLVDVRPFDFVTLPSLRAVLVSDWIEAQKAFAAGAYKAAALLVGGLLEGLLVNALQRPDIASGSEYVAAVRGFPRLRGSKDINWDRVSLQQLIEAAVSLQTVSETAAHLASGARDFRDTVHPLAEVRLAERAQLEEAKVLMALFELLYRAIPK